MTIKVEQEVVLRVVQNSNASHPPLPVGDDFLLVDFRKPSNDFDGVEKILSADDDDDSIFTISTASLSDTDSEIQRRVSFAEDLVSEEWTRPFTPKDEVSSLFYSTEETQRFRQEYRLERKLLTELSVDPETFPVENEEFSALVASTASQPTCGYHRISRVVVLHNDKLETFYSPDADVNKEESPASDDFFDNDSFWSGSITWY